MEKAEGEVEGESEGEGNILLGKAKRGWLELLDVGMTAEVERSAIELVRLQWRGDSAAPPWNHGRRGQQEGVQAGRTDGKQRCHTLLLSGMVLAQGSEVI
jgi:hypothetical protein